MLALLGWRVYALIGLGVVVLAVAGVIYAQNERHKADVAQLSSAKQTIAQFSNALAQAEADKADLARKAKELDAAIQERDARLKALNETKRKLADELDRLKNAVPPEDKACLDRPLPGGILDLLRDGSADRHEDDTGDSPGKPVPALH